ncbi:hypothetical protein BDW02DRAFT_600556 [Decorospora gaudefroyi]|uniref:Uncharacterized protein n=1 Tax=Decorospora gaudefroyi TaxID=184978 RepID=A0A6A5K4Q5_9PLEO|nr:hypothetical protein BDW02DRAFT_600556 [Decorospora gaudefroyi]
MSPKKPTNSPETNPLSPHPLPTSLRRKKKPYKPLSPLDSNTDRLFHIVQRTHNKTLASLLSGPRLEIVNETTGHIQVRRVPTRMLQYFCGPAILDAFASDRASILKIPNAAAEKVGIARVVRRQRVLSSAIDTIRACRLFGLEGDAVRIEELVVYGWMGAETWYMTDEHVEMIWDGYEGVLRETVLGDAVVWFVLNEVQGGAHALSEEIRWMLEQEEYDGLKVKVYDENLDGRWRLEGRDEYLERCREEREEELREQELGEEEETYWSAA